MVSCVKASYIKFVWAGADISAVRAVDDLSILFEHFPWDYHSMAGDGTKEFEIQAKWITEAGITTGEIVGEEV